MKNCIKCKLSKELKHFYKHAQMSDGHLNKCKDCCKSDALKNRKNNLEYYQEYDRQRGNRQSNDYRKDWRLKYSNKYKAETMVGNAIRDKKLFKQPCEICGTKKIFTRIMTTI